MNTKHDDVAVIGLSGKFPGANSVSEFWENLCAGRESIRALSDDELRAAGVPERDIADPSYVKAASLLDDVDKFDPAFFKISPLEAELMDPQIRLLLQCAWETLEDAGRATRDAQNIGVFAGAGGVTTSYLANYINRHDRFEHITAGATHLGNDKDFLATYLSYKLNLTGPSVTVQTACSTSLVALHQAKLSLLAGECDMALAGGVTVRVPHVQGYEYREGYIFSKSGRIKTFDESADGVVFGSGLGLVLIKRLADALRDGDPIHAVIKGSAIANDGKGKMSYAASSAKGQIACVRAALKNAEVDAGSIGYVESHGTGTAMGDPEEVKALSMAFKEQTDKKGYCVLGAVKTNIGHLEAAAGIVGLIKAVLAVKHGVIPPTLHYTQANPRIKFENTPFVVNTELQKWSEGKRPRRAAINSLGVGGTNAFVIVEQHVVVKTAAKTVAKKPVGPFVVPVSAKTDASLQAYLGRLADFLDAATATKKATVDLAELAHTLQSGRDAMDRRRVFVVSTLDELKAALRASLNGEVLPLPDGLPAAITALLSAWSAGEDADWASLQGGAAPRRTHLPTTVFAKERCWVDEPAPSVAAPSLAAIHPLLHTNTSDLNEQRYSATFSGDEFFLRDHLVRTRARSGAAEGEAPLQKVLPGVAYLEMARAAIEQAAPLHHDARVLELRDVVWLQPIAVGPEVATVNIAVLPRDGGQPLPSAIDFEVYTQDDQIHCQGRSVFIEAAATEPVDTAALKAAMRRRQWTADEVYAAYTGMGLSYGPAHRTVASIAQGDRQLLAQLVLDTSSAAGSDSYVLHPGLMDGALQAATTLLFAGQPPRHPIVPFALASLRVLAPCQPVMQAWARHAEGSLPGDKSIALDVDLLDADGKVCVQIRGFSARALGRETLGSLLATQAWQASPVAAPQAAAHVEPHLIVCDLPQLKDVSKLARDGTLLMLDAKADPAQRYAELALACFAKAQSILLAKPQGKVLLQLVLPIDAAHAIHAGLSGLFKTLKLENPQLAGQIVFVEPTIGAEALATLLQAERAHPHDTLVRHAAGVRELAQWRFLPGDADDAFIADGPFKDRGVYLITGGLGGLGVLFANEILARTPQATVVLTGRASPSEVAKSKEKSAVLASLQAGGAKVEYRHLDLEDPNQVVRLIAATRKTHGQLNGVIHAAGMTADNFILKKSADEFRRVLAPKVAGTWNLDLATRELDLDFFVLFSSLTSAAGNLGQADYAAANGFMDEFAGQRKRLVQDGKRHGLTVSMRWPLWQDGGMQPGDAGREMLHETTGIHPMQTATGMRMFYRSLALGLDQTLVMEGDLGLMQRTLGVGQALHAAGDVAGADVAAQTAVTAAVTMAADRAGASLAEQAEGFLCTQMATLLKIAANRLDPRAPLEDYGIDSILALDLTRLLEKSFGALPKTLFFEYLTIRELAGYFASAHAATLAGLFADAAKPAAAAAVVANAPALNEAQPAPAESASSSARLSIRTHRRVSDDTSRHALNTQPSANHIAEPIAIVGLSGRYPEARDLDVFWEKLRDGEDCIVEVPASRWNWRDYYSEDRSQKGRHFSKWGGFIEGVDEFDARFFNISPLEAETIDPQERLFLQHAWMAMEDAGSTRASLQIPKAGDLPAQVGVYAGVMYGEYQLFGAEASLQGQRMGFASNPSSIANRVSYVLNLHGPSMAVDTMCSSSLTAIHLACQDLRLGRTALGIAGGVNVTIHPNKYLMLSAGQFISGDGHCQSFGEGGDGYIPGEGVGVVVLKRLSEAVRDGNRIHGIIRGTALSHGGKTNGYTVPNPQAQASAIRQAFAEAQVNPRHISYIEAHGTGTKLGDPIEIAALSRVFQEHSADTGFCLIGSAKSNIGHAEAAAGIAGLTKVLLQMRHRQVVPSLHSARLNPHIDFGRSPFVVNQVLRPWEAPVVDGRVLPRIAGISSFGAGGSNAHLVIEEYVPVAAPLAATGTLQLLPISARTAEQLRQKACDLAAWMSGVEASALPSIAYTLQAGREAMDFRLAVLADSPAALASRLQAWLDGNAPSGVFSAQAKEHRDTLALLTQGAGWPTTLSGWIAARQLDQLAELWTQGLELDWTALHAVRPPLVGLPAYPFAKQRHWIDVAGAVRRAPKGQGAAVLHPLVHRNSSDFDELRYSATFEGDEFFLTGEAGQRSLSAAACVEMARAAIGLALPQATGVLELRDLTWAQPQPALDGEVSIALFDQVGAQLAFEIYRSSADGELVLCQGRATHATSPALQTLDLASLAATAAPGRHAVVALKLSAELAASAAADAKRYGLHPASLQVALDAAAAFAGASAGTGFAALNSLRLHAPHVLPTQAWVRADASNTGWDVDLCDAQGRIVAALRGLRSAAVAVMPSAVVSSTTAARALPSAAHAASAGAAIASASGARVHAHVAVAPAAPVRLSIPGAAVSVAHTAAPLDKPTSLRFREAGAVETTPLLDKPARSIALAMPGAAASSVAASAISTAQGSALASALIASGEVPAKPTAIALAAVAAAKAPTAAAELLGKPRLALAALTQALSSAASSAHAFVDAPAGDADLALFDHGQGLHVLRIEDATEATLTSQRIDALLRALQAVAGRASAQVLVLEGTASHFFSGDLAAHQVALERGLYRAVVEFPLPVIAVVRGEVQGAGLVLAAACDFLVADDAARLGLSIAQAVPAAAAESAPRQTVPASAVRALLTERFGATAASELMYFSPQGLPVAALSARGLGFPVLPAAKLEAGALDLARQLAKKSPTSLRLLKHHLARRIAAEVQALPQSMEASAQHTPVSIAAMAESLAQATSPRLAWSAKADAVLQLTLRAPAEADGLQALFDELKPAFAQLAASDCRALVIASELPGFLPALAPQADAQRAEAAQAWIDLVAGLTMPVIAATNGAQGLGWLIAQLCEACVCDQAGRYAATGLPDDPALSGLLAAALSRRLDGDAAMPWLLNNAEHSGTALQALGLSEVVAGTEVLPRALALATSLAALPTAEASAWKQAEQAALQAQAQVLTAALKSAPAEADESAEAHADRAPVALQLQSQVISAQLHAHGVLEVRMADRDAKNMFSPAFSDGMRELFARIADDAAVRVVVLTGYDNYFASGGTPDTLLSIHEGQSKFTDNNVFQLPLACPVPVVAAMQGHGIGAGWALGMYADLTVFSDESRYFSPYMGYGFTPGAGSTQMFPARIGHDLARETLMTAQEYSGGELKARGLRNAVLPREQVLAEALRLAAGLARLGRGRLAALKQVWAGALRAELPDTFARELAMHGRTFVGQADTLARIQGRFGSEPVEASKAVAPSAVAVPQATASIASVAVPNTAVASPAADVAAIAASLRTMLAHELRMPEDEIGDDEQFVDLGLDSITGVTWIRRINDSYGTSIEAIKVYSHPTLAQLARFVQTEMPASAVVSVAAAAAPLAAQPAAVAPAATTASVAVAVTQATAASTDTLIATLRSLLANELRMPEDEIGDDEQFVDLGLDSITGVTWIRRINETYGTAIEAIKVYSHPTLAQLAAFVRDEAVKAGTWAPVESAPAPAAVVASAASASLAAHATTALGLAPIVAAGTGVLRSWRTRRSATKPSAASTGIGLQPIAVIGMAGQFAKAQDLDTFWQNIAAGRDCIDEVPASRWDIDHYFQAGDVAPGKTTSRWMGGLDDYDLFDASFFNVSPREARAMDPQQRVFLQACWHGIEHAGYNPKALGGSRCGVFVGASAGDYHQLSRREQLSGQGFTGAAPSILAARIAYVLDLHGPNLSIDTACSSSLVAIASACDSLVLGSSDLALAGGVNVMAGPMMQIMTAQVGMLSPQGRCFTFDARANGIANGEGVGVILLKRLADAERDGDCIHGVIEGWGVNQDGKTNGITAPNADSQARLQQEVYERFGIDPVGIQLIEAHGTGTALGDPIEIAGLKTSFAKHTQQANFCALGSVKSNIGHCLTAAGISGTLKLLLALKHEQLPPTIHFQKLNPHIQLQGSPFYVNERLKPWTVAAGQRRRGAVNSFGFSGTNAHVVIAQAPVVQAVAPRGEPVLLPLSAKTPAQLLQQAQALWAFVKRADAKSFDLDRIAYTLQAGREPMSERAAFVARNAAELEAALQGFIDRETRAIEAGEGASVAASKTANAFRGQVGPAKGTLLAMAADADFQAMVAKWIAKRELARVADLWVQGLAIDWQAFHAGQALPRRIGLPLLYPFAKERHWLEADAGLFTAPSFAASAAGGTAVVLHPLVHRNVSDLSGQKYRSLFGVHSDGREFFVAGGVLSAAACLEMVRAAVADAAPGHASCVLADVVWADAVPASELTIALAAEGDGRVFFQICSGANADTVHCEGHAELVDAAAPTRVDLNALRSRLSRVASATNERHAGVGELLALLTLPPGLQAGAQEFQLHPALIDEALQLARGVAGLPASEASAMPAAIGAVQAFGASANSSWVWARVNAVGGVDLTLCDGEGRVTAELLGVVLEGQGLLASAAHAVATLAVAPAAPTRAVEVAVGADSIPERKVAAPAQSTAPLQSELQTELRASLADALFMQPSDVGLDKSFHELGLDSIIGVEWVKALNKRYGTQISATRVYDHPSVKALAAYIVGLMGAASNAVTPVAAAAVAVPAASVPASPATASLNKAVPASVPAAAKASVVILAKPVAALQTELRESLAEALFMQTSDVGLEKSFHELGLDSIIGVEWVKALNKRYGTLISATRVYDHPNVKALAVYIAGLMSASASPAAVATASSVTAPSLPTTPAMSAALVATPAVAASVVAPVAAPSAAGSAFVSASATAKASVAIPVKPTAELQTELRASLAEALFMQPSDVGLDKSFHELGLDSIIGVEWVKALNKRYGTQISATRVYDHPNVKALAAYIGGLMGAAASAAPAVQATASTVAPTAVSTTPMASPTAAALKASPAVPLAQLQAELKDSLADALFMQPSDVGLDKSFHELGLDSIIGVEWVKGLNKRYGTQISATRVYDHPSVKALAAHIASLTGSSNATAPAAPLAPAVRSASADTAAAQSHTAVPAASAITATAQSAPATFGRTRATGRALRANGLNFQPKFGRDFKSLYFYSAEGEGDFERDGEFSLRLSVSPDTNVCLQEHVVFGQHLMPTDAYIELVYSACRTWFAADSIALKNLVIVNPMLGVPGAETPVRVVFRRHAEGLQVFVKSGVDVDSEVLHLQGLVTLSAAAGTVAVPSANFAIERELSGTQIPTNAGRYYAPLQSLQLGASAATGVIRTAEHGFGFLANPFALYGGLCTVINLAGHIAGRQYGASDDQFLPYRINQLRVLGAIEGRDFRCQAEVLTQDHDAIEFRYVIVNAAGVPVLAVDSIVLRRVPRSAIQPRSSNTSAKLPALRKPTRTTSASAHEPIAIIGMAARYPKSENLEAFWENLKAGRDCVTEVPAGRWGAEADWFHPDPRHPHTSYSKWGGFLERIDTFDALFFGISPAEAELIDPQQRIFLEECWKAIESAGQAPSALSGRACGVYVGCASGDYTRVLAAEGQDTAGAAFMGSSSAILAARIAYHLNLKGPALAIDTACSSSLVAVHLACESIRHGENELALAGGINILATPIGHILTSQVGMPSRDGRSATFDAAANGIVYSEGCGVLLLKSLAAAERDHDPILGVIAGSGTNQDGKTNGITAPSSLAQAALLRQVYERFGIDPKQIGYVEAHGTATPLGDPIEVNALGSVFGTAAGGAKTCALGSVKSNIGHTGFAAGVAGIVKVLLCLKHKQLVPSIHYRQANPHIEFEQTPFYVNTELRAWESVQPRLATVSSFGFSGTNAHLVIGEHVSSRSEARGTSSRPALVPLSAKTEDQLLQQVRELLDHIRRLPDTVALELRLEQIAHTLQVGRDAMEHRVAMVVKSIDELQLALQAIAEGRSRVAGVYRGRASQADDTLAAFAGDDELRQVVERWIVQKNLPKIADLWVKGFELDLGPLHAGEGLRRIALPTYPFAQERCWVEPSGRVATGFGGGKASGLSLLHPLLHRNVSDLGQQGYSSRFSGQEFFLDGHRVNGQPVLPAVAYLEMARAALRDAVPGDKAGLHFELSHVVWPQPIVATQPRQVEIAVYAEEGDQLGFEVYTLDEQGAEVLHCQGRCTVTALPAPEQLNLAALRAEMQRPVLDGGVLYPAFAALGLNYGPAFQGIVEVAQGDQQVLVELSLPAALRAGAPEFVLHPSLMDSALQASITLGGDLLAGGGQPALPFALESLQVLAACTERMVAWVRPSAGQRVGSGLVKVDIDLCDVEGQVCVRMRGFSSRPMERAAVAAPVPARPVLLAPVVVDAVVAVD